MKKVIFLLFASLLCVACSNDDDNTDNKQEFQITNENLSGEWFYYDEIGNTGQLLSLNSNLSHVISSLKDLSKDIQIVDYSKGPWSISGKKNLILRSISEITGMQQDFVFEIVSVDEYNLVLRNKELNNTMVFSKIAQVKDLYIGESFDINSSVPDSFVPQRVLTINKNVLSESLSKIEAIGSGMTFVIVYSDKNSVVFSVNVNPYVSLHASEIGKNIEDIKAKYGEPTKSGDLGNGITYYVYNQQTVDKTLKAMQINFDTASKKVTRVLGLYNNYDDWMNDYEFIISHYYYDTALDLFSDNRTSSSASIYITPFHQDESYYVNYADAQFFIEHGYHSNIR